MATKKKAGKKHVKINKFHDLPGVNITRPFIKEFKVEDNNGNWKIERPLFRWVRVHKEHAESEAQMLNIGYQIAMYDLAARRPQALKNFAKLKEEMKRIEKQMKGVIFE